eukprot:1531619-Rhodomonas_salina.1
MARVMQGQSAKRSAPAGRNQMQITASSVKLVPGMWVICFEFGTTIHQRHVSTQHCVVRAKADRNTATGSAGRITRVGR